MRRYLAIFIGAFLLAVGSMLMILSAVAKNVGATMFWEMLGAYLNVLYSHFLIEAPDWRSRLKLATVQGLGLALGAGLTIFIYKQF